MKDELEKALSDGDASVVHVGLFDLAGLFRERRLRREEAVAMADSASFVNVLPQWDSADSLFGSGPFVSERITYDVDSLRPFPFEPDAVAMVADYAGPSRELMPREQLRKQVARAADMGFAVQAAFEFEFIVLDETAESLRESNFAPLARFAPENRCWSGQTAATHAEFVADLEAVLRAGDVPPFALGVELGPGCFEVTLRTRDAMRAADDAAFFRLFTRSFCRQRGLTASFMALLGPEYPGLGGHINLSLIDPKTGENLFAKDQETGGLSDLAHAFIAGMIEIVPECFAMCAHTTNAYRRFAPGTWAPKTVSWAPWNYAAAVRTVPEPADECRLEFRLPGADTNVHAALALMLGAGLSGIERDLTPPPPIEGGGPEEIPAGVPRLPNDLFEAASRLKAGDSSRSIFGDAFVERFATACFAEDAALRRAVSAEERARYLEFG